MIDSRRSACWCALFALVIGGACTPDEGAPPLMTVRDSSGVQIVEIEDTVVRAVTASHVADLVPPDSVLSAMPSGVAASSSHGLIYVADRFNDRVVTFDTLGALVREIGGSGSGPGEFTSPTALYVGTDETLRVWDTGRGVISRWSPSGEHLGEERSDVRFWGPGFTSETDRLLTVTNGPIQDVSGMAQRLEVHRAEGHAVLHELVLPMQMMELPCMTGPAPTVLAPSLIWAGRGSLTFIHKHPDYRIDVYDGEQMIRSIRRDVPLIDVSEEMAAEAVEFGPTPYRPLLSMCNVTAIQMVRAVGYEEQVSPIMALAVGPNGRLWITRTEDGVSSSSVDVIESDGTLRFSIEIPAAVVAVPSARRLVTFRLDQESGSPVLSLYSLDDAITVQLPDSEG